MTIRQLEEKYGEEEVRKAREQLKGISWAGSEEEMIESLIKQWKRRTHI